MEGLEIPNQKEIESFLIFYNYIILFLTFI